MAVAWLRYNMTLSTFFLVAKIDSSLLFLNVIATLFGHGLIVLVTVRSKALKSSCNVLIAIESAITVVRQLEHIFTMYYFFTEQTTSSITCLYLNFFPLVVVDLSSLLMLFIAVDRLISAKFPFFYLHISGRKYIAGILLSCMAYTAVFKVLNFMSFEEKTIYCFIGQLMTGLKNRAWFPLHTSINVAVVVIYIVLTRVTKASMTEYHKINHSLNLIILVHFFGWIVPVASTYGFAYISPSYLFFTVAQLTVAVVANITVCVPCFIFYFRSTVYQAEINRLLGLGTTQVGVRDISTF
uniref:G_PROTEIN_RECEP_F1_2 domain-containing protein n=1 Tax=Steinernema glaseri TaxID=37863 RepID=A0A1I7ZJL3_9BILA